MHGLWKISMPRSAWHLHLLVSIPCLESAGKHIMIVVIQNRSGGFATLLGTLLSVRVGMNAPGLLYPLGAVFSLSGLLIMRYHHEYAPAEVSGKDIEHTSRENNSPRMLVTLVVVSSRSN